MEEDLHADYESPFSDYDPNNTESASGNSSAELDGPGTIISNPPCHWASQ